MRAESQREAEGWAKDFSAKLAKEQGAHNATKRQVLRLEEKLQNSPERALELLEASLRASCGGRPKTHLEIDIQFLLLAHREVEPGARPPWLVDDE